MIMRKGEIMESEMETEDGDRGNVIEETEIGEMDEGSSREK